MESLVPSKLNHPFPWIAIMITGGIISTGGLVYKIAKTSILKSNLHNIVTVVKQENLITNIEVDGTLEPIESIDVSPKYPGRLVQLLTQQGEKVKKGQILALMERAEIRAEGKVAEAKYSQSLAQMEVAKISIPSEIQKAQSQYVKLETKLEKIRTRLRQISKTIPKKVEQFKIELVSSQSNLQLATSRMKRGEELLKEGVITQDDFDELLNDYHKAKAIFLKNETFLKQITSSRNLEINQLRQEVLQVTAEVTEAQIIVEERKKIAKNEFSRLGSLINESKAQLERVVIKFEDTAIRAPFDGLIVRQYAKPGEFINPISFSLNSVVSLARGLKVTTEISKTDISRVKKEQLVTITSNAYPEKLFQGQVTKVFSGTGLKNNIKTSQVTIKLITGENELSPQTNLKVSFLEKNIPNGLTIPNNTIITKEGKTGVVLINEFNRPEFQPVTLGRVWDSRTEIIFGLNPGDKLLINSLKKINNI